MLKKIIYLFFMAFAFNVKAQTTIQSWVRTFHGPGADDIAKAICVDTNGDVFVTGASLSANGYPDYNFATIKYSNVGLALWTNFYDGAGNSYDQPVAIKLDSKGNVFITGASYGTPINGPDFATLAYASGGTPLWTNRFNGPEFSTDQAMGLAVDNNDDVCVVGYSDSAYAVIKYSNAGQVLWTNFLTGPDSAPDASSAIATDTDGNILIGGASVGSNGYIRYATAKYSPSGTPMWTNFYSGPGNYSDKPTGIAVDKNGHAFVTGISWGTGTGFDFATVAYSSAGVPLWTNRFNGAGNDWDGATGIAVDTNGNVFVTGYAPLIGGGSHNFATLAYSNSGTPLWTNIYSEMGNDDEPSAILVNSDGNVCVTGYSVGSGTGADYATIIYSSAGWVLSTNRYNDPANNTDYANAIAMDGNRDIFVTGFSDGGYATIKYSARQPAFLGIEKRNNCVVLSWTNATFSLQCSPVVSGNFTNLVGATSPYTNPVIGPQLFFRLQGN